MPSTTNFTFLRAACACSLVLTLMVGGARRLSAEVGVAKGSEAGTIYSPVGKRDPFKPPASDLSAGAASVNPAEKYGVDRYLLRAILKGIGKPRAMFEDPDGKSFILAEGDVIGRERRTISRVLNSEVIITERTFNYLGAESLYERVVSLPADDDNPGLTFTAKPALVKKADDVGGALPGVPDGGGNRAPATPPAPKNAPPAAAPPAKAPAPAAPPAPAEVPISPTNLTNDGITP